MKKKVLSLLAMLTVAMTGAWAQSAVSGAFTVNASGDKVQFASGNLQATYDGTVWSWDFAAQQYDYIGVAAGNTSINGNGTVSASNVTVDLFGWVGASSTWTGVAQYGISNATATSSTSTYGNSATESLKSDWGTLIGDGNTWRTLTNAEWTYVFTTRTTGGTVGSTSQARYAHATINTDDTGVNGMILFPDGVDFASSEFTTLGTVNSISDYATKCTSTQWAALETKGCVFLPAAGFRNGTTVSDGYGRYWSSTAATKANSYYAGFSTNNLNIGDKHYTRSRGYSVRLVKTYVTELTLAETDDNSTALSTADGGVYDVTLTRTLQTGAWNSFAVPFDIDATMLTTMGMTAKKLTDATLSAGVLTLTFADAESIEAGKPYLVKVSANVENPTFSGVTISSTATTTETTAVDFIPTLGKTTIGSEGDDARTVLYLGASNKLYNPTTLPAEIKGFRAYFLLTGEVAAARAFIIDFGDGETTGIMTIDAERTATTTNSEIYTLDGRRLQGQPTQKGVYVVNGKKVIIK